MHIVRFYRITRKGLFTIGLMLSILAVASSCAMQTSPYFPPPVGEQTRTIFLISHGLHAGIALRPLDIKYSGWPKLHEFSYAEYLEIGWGDRSYYTSPDPGAGLATRALFLPTSSVLHVVGFNGSPQRTFPSNEIIKIELSVSGFEQMVGKISESFSRDENGSVVHLGPGHYNNSSFYASNEIYHLCKTCNTWTATILQAAGCPITLATTVNGLMSQARSFGVVIQKEAESQ